MKLIQPCKLRQCGSLPPPKTWFLSVFLQIYDLIISYIVSIQEYYPPLMSLYFPLYLQWPSYGVINIQIKYLWFLLTFYKLHVFKRSLSVSFDQVKAHIQSYLKNLEENLLLSEDRTELYLLFVNCFQVKGSDSLPLCFLHEHYVQSDDNHNYYFCFFHFGLMFDGK